MSDTFWVQFFIFLAILAKGILDEVQRRNAREYNRQMKEELHANTVATVAGNEETTANAIEAKKAATIAAETSVVIEKETKGIKDVTNEIAERLNGGETGLSNRVSKNEATLEAFGKELSFVKQGQVKIASAVETLIISVADLSKRYEEHK
jgi:hypothetical protein